jgi:putative aldouronate transport system permease protein
VVARPAVRPRSRAGVSRALRRNSFYYLLALPGLLYFLVFEYVPMLGIVIAFKDITPFSGIEGVLYDPFVGFTHFQTFFRSYFFQNVMTNTLVVSGLKLAVGFPAPIVLALLINEVRSTAVKRTVQTISYLPHFLSTVIVAGLVVGLLSTEGGLVNQLVRLARSSTSPRWRTSTRSSTRRR